MEKRKLNLMCELLFKCLSKKKYTNIKLVKDMMNGNFECGACLPRIENQEVPIQTILLALLIDTLVIFC